MFIVIILNIYSITDCHWILVTFSYPHFEELLEIFRNKFCELREESMVNIRPDVSECENKELWINDYTLTLVP